MTDPDRATGQSPVDLDGWTEVLPEDDAADLMSSDLRYAATFLGFAVLIIAAGIAAVRIM